MRLATYHDGAGERPAAIVGEELVDLSSVAGSTLALLEGGEGALVAARAAIASGERRALDGVRLVAPVRPRKFFAIGLNYADHVEESGLEMPRNLTVFTKAPTCVVGPTDAVQRPVVSEWLDYEGELGIVIGRRCRHVTAETAAEVIAGYLVVNDVSVRDWQTMTGQWSLGKSFDTHGPIGPAIVTADEVGDPHELDVRTWVNDELRQSSNTKHLIFTCYEIVEILSQACTLEPGDVIATGTPSGVAAGMEGRPWLVPGDNVRVEIEGLGALENTIVAEPAPNDFAVNPAWVGGRDPAPR